MLRLRNQVFAWQWGGRVGEGGGGGKVVVSLYSPSEGVSKEGEGSRQKKFEELEEKRDTPHVVGIDPLERQVL